MIQSEIFKIPRETYYIDTRIIQRGHREDGVMGLAGRSLSPFNAVKLGLCEGFDKRF